MKKVNKADLPCALVLTPTCKGCGQPLLGFGTPQGPRCPFEIVGGGCTALAKLKLKEKGKLKKKAQKKPAT